MQRFCTTVGARKEKAALDAGQDEAGEPDRIGTGDPPCLDGLGDSGAPAADLVAVPHADAMLVKLPAGVDPLAVVSASDNIPDGWRTVGPQLAADPGAEVLVVGGEAGPNSIGLYAAGFAAALGAQAIDGAPPRKAGAFPITVDASGVPEGLRCALNSTAFDGTCTSASIYLEDPALPLFSMYSRCSSPPPWCPEAPPSTPWPTRR